MTLSTASLQRVTGCFFVNRKKAEEAARAQSQREAKALQKRIEEEKKKEQQQQSKKLQEINVRLQTSEAPSKFSCVAFQPLFFVCCAEAEVEHAASLSAAFGGRSQAPIE